MKAIFTKYLGATNYRGSRIKASAGKISVTIPFDYEHDSGENHKRAAMALVKELDWASCVFYGGTEDSTGDMVWVIASDSYRFTC